MRVVLLTGDQSNQRALAHRLAEVCGISAIVVSRNIPRRTPDLKRRLQLLRNRFAGRLFGRPFVDAWFELLRSYDEEFPRFPETERVDVGNINDPATLETIARMNPELTIVSGTNLVGTKVIAGAGRIVNLHTGISPYVKGGPNCTNWCLARGWYHLIGNTVMWLDRGIDTGKLIATEQTPLTGGESLFELHRKVMDHAHDLYVRAVARIASGATMNAVPQSDIAEGRVFYTADWTATEMRSAARNFRDGFPAYFQGSPRPDLEPKLVPLEA